MQLLNKMFKNLVVRSSNLKRWINFHYLIGNLIDALEKKIDKHPHLKGEV